MSEWSSKWNPFNSDKLLAHLYRWKEIKRGCQLPVPVTISIDPINLCDLECVWCNADYILKHNSKKIDTEVLMEIALFLSVWHSKTNFNYKVETVCVGGGGESLLHPDVGKFIKRCTQLGIKVGIVTNGTNLTKHIDSLNYCTWVGVSVDAGRDSTYEKLKGKKIFDKVITNIKELVDLSRNKKSQLGLPGQGHGVSYKYLLHPGNVNDIYEAAKLAKKSGCRNLHIRPFGEPWDQIGQLKTEFSYSDIIEFREQLKQARALEDKNFKVFGITHKFDGNFRRKNEFNQCHAIFMTGVFMPPSGDGKFDFSLCCDRRGDDNMTLKNLTSPIQVADFWGSKEHWKVFEKIKVKECPRCTYQPHNIIYEKVIKVDNMTYQFI
jgi:MoaA/NifB/PqqE/SkfB family radical SAM enzyme